MAEPTLSIDYTDLRRFVGRYLGLKEDPDDWSAAQVAYVNDIIDSGYRQFLSMASYNGQPYVWSFLRPTLEITTVAPYSTGTIEVVAGVVTLSDGTFPAWADEGELTYNNTDYPVATRDSGTQLTLEDTSLNVDAGASYSLGRSAYVLPDNFAQFEGPLTYRPGDSDCYPAIIVTNEAMIRVERQHYGGYTDRPTKAAIRVRDHDPTVGTRWELVFNRIVDAAYVLTARYLVNQNKLSLTNLYPAGGTMHAETIKESVLAVAERERNDTAGVHQQMFLALLANSVNNDRRAGTPETVGYHGDRERIVSSDRIPRAAYYARYDGHTLFGE